MGLCNSLFFLRLIPAFHAQVLSYTHASEVWRPGNEARSVTGIPNESLTIGLRETANNSRKGVDYHKAIINTTQRKMIMVK